MKHQGIRQRRTAAARRRQARNCLWLIAAAGCIAFVLVAALGRPSSPGRAVRTAADTGAVAPAAGNHGGPGGPMEAGSGALNAGPGSPDSQNAGGSSGNPSNATTATSNNWAGYAVSGTPGSFTSVSSAWTEPAVTCTAQQTFSSFWVGLDGAGTQTVEQTGTEADCGNGKPSYQGWFEMFPSTPVFYNSPVAPGDAMTASVVANGGGAFTLTLSDQTQAWTQTTHQTSAAAQLGSAEIVTEAPSDAASVLPLSSFGTVNFANALVDGAPLADVNPAGLTMVSTAGVPEATPSALTSETGFSVTRDSNGTAAASTASSSPVPTVPATTSPTASPSPTISSSNDGWWSWWGHHHHHDS